MLNSRNKALLIGGRGNIGSVILENLKENNYFIYSTTTSDALNEFIVTPEVEWLMGMSLDNIKSKIDGIEPLDSVVFAQGKNSKIPTKFLSQDKLLSILNANFNYVVETIQCLIKAKKLNKGASIVFISSISSVHYSVSNAAYSASKAALEAYANTLVLELAPQRIRVNIIRPGLLEGKMKDAYALDDSMNEFIQKIPLKRLGTAQDVANLTMFLLSDKSSWMTGSTIDLDGGIKFI